MKVLFQSRLDIFKRYGGDTAQMLETKASLEKLGVDVDIDCSLDLDVSKYDIVHIFNLDWVCETYPQIANAKEQGKKVVLSPIHHSQEEFDRYENENRYGLMRLGNLLILSQPLRDVARNILKGIIYPEKLRPAILQLFMGIRKQQRLSLEMSDFVLVQTVLEARDLKKDFGARDFRWKKVINGIDAKKFKNVRSKSKSFAGGDVILCVGRIEPRKNQLKLISAYKRMKGAGMRLVFVGSLNRHHPTYIKKFLDLVKSSYGDISYMGFVSQEKLINFYAEARVFIIPSWFETTGLAYLEAAVCGVPSIVACGERAREYLGDNALYCDPGSVRSIKNALSHALKTVTLKKGFADYAKKTYTWDNCAKETKLIYEKVLGF